MGACGTAGALGLRLIDRFSREGRGVKKHNAARWKHLTA